ncbi:MAG: LOG family protein [Patescibacteria group bacterium]|nr:LOG family protein [Patescibacteria group bacterium]MCL5431943.1 LOG family protein [Patescibacteria group bacterium]
MEIKKVAFLGWADAKEGDKDYLASFETAKLLARNGYVVVNGGGPGVMRAATEGAHAGSGRAIGITFYPTAKEKPDFFEGRDAANKFDEEIKTNTYVERTLKIMEVADVYVVFNGGTGTISEFGMAWGLARLHFGHHKPLLLYGPWWHDVIEVFGRNMHLRPEELKVYHIVTSPQEVLIKIESLGSNE